ncbi:SpaH/EbpB family LPXTG-anchored major pilin [Salinibacterium sp. ZJ70]|uniref:SpaH/EbpB family LPXTG-anchored major pilin n=1 Tax=Salinibacterium sp. ZJ70 TaxID=2708084 RepID=UPI00142392B4|nr:SpaH/EbpB family LPXTG-anchored major pilin [Salinibacterium sp. ZJ70]
MTTSLFRAVAVAAGAMFTAIAVSSGAVAAHAAPLLPVIDPDQVTAIVVHKLEQPVDPGLAADGLPLDTAGFSPVAGAGFSATRVPGVDVMTPEGQRAAAAMTPSDAAALISSASPDATGTTGSDGLTTLSPLAVGLYYVQETVTPAGYVGAAPFLVALPMTHPTDRGGWLSTVHVYPKGAPARLTLDVSDANARALGDEVTWTARADIPRMPTIDGYRIVHEIDPKLDLVDGTARVRVAFGASGAPVLEGGVHYTVSLSPDGLTFTVDFTESGRTLLAQHTGSHVLVEFPTTVLGEGELVVKASLYPSKAIIDAAEGAPGPVEAQNLTKWGALKVQATERGKPWNPVAGACFMVYASEADARDRVNPITVNGVSEWRTDANGLLNVNGLRFSAFVDGLDREASDPLYRHYWAVPSCVPTGWKWTDDRPLPGVIDSVINAKALAFEVEDSNDLATTGAQVAGTALLAAVLIGGGLLLVARRRERQSESAHTL